MALFSAQTVMGMMDTYETHYKSYVASYTFVGHVIDDGKSSSHEGHIASYSLRVYVASWRQEFGLPTKDTKYRRMIETGLNTFGLGVENFTADTENELPLLKFAAFPLSLVTHLNEMALDVDKLANKFGIDVI